MPLSDFKRATCVAALIALCALASPAARADDAQDVSKLIHEHQLDEAMQRIEAILAQKPRDAQMRFFKGLILSEQGRSNDAIGVFLRLTEDYPELPEPYNNLAVLYAGQGEYEKARASLEMAIRTHPSYATAHENLGDVYAKLASQAYDKALQLDSNNTAAQTKLALIRELISANPNATRKPSAATPRGSAATLADSRTSSATTTTSAPPTKSVAAAPSVAATVAAPPAPKPAVESTPVPTPGVAPPGQQDVITAVNAWAKAWSSKDVDAYLAMYASDFVTPPGTTRKQWEDERRARIVGKASISVTLEDLEVSVDGDKAVARFRQDYRADTLKANSRKTLNLIKSNGHWLIQQERSGA
jgi:tetratricopeptide (TPR) repeat protein